MIIQLILKDLRVFWKSILFLALLCLIVNSAFFLLISESWTNFAAMGISQVSFVTGFYLVSEKIHHGEILCCSLPVTRSGIVRAKYLSSLFIAAAGIIIWFFITPGLMTGDLSMSGQFFGPVSWIFFLYLVLFISIFIPCTLLINKVWVLINGSIFLAFIFLSFLSLALPDYPLAIPNSSGIISYIIPITILVFGVFSGSLLLASNMYNQKEF